MHSVVPGHRLVRWLSLQVVMVQYTVVLLGVCFDYYRLRHMFHSDVADSNFKVADCSFMKEQEVLQTSAAFLFAAGVVTSFLDAGLKESLLFGCVLALLLTAVVASYFVRVGILLLWNMAKDCLRQLSKESPLMSAPLVAQLLQTQHSWEHAFETYPLAWQEGIADAIQHQLPGDIYEMDVNRFLYVMSLDKDAWAALKMKVDTCLYYKNMKTRLRDALVPVTILAALSKVSFAGGMLSWIAAILYRRWEIAGARGELYLVAAAVGAALIGATFMAVAATRFYSHYHSRMWTRWSDGRPWPSEPEPDFTRWRLREEVDARLLQEPPDHWTCYLCGCSEVDSLAAEVVRLRTTLTAAIMQQEAARSKIESVETQRIELEQHRTAIDSELAKILKLYNVSSRGEATCRYRALMSALETEKQALTDQLHVANAAKHAAAKQEHFASTWRDNIQQQLIALDGVAGASLSEQPRSQARIGQQQLVHLPSRISRATSLSPVGATSSSDTSPAGPAAPVTYRAASAPASSAAPVHAACTNSCLEVPAVAAGGSSASEALTVAAGTTSASETPAAAPGTTSASEAPAAAPGTTSAEALGGAKCTASVSEAFGGTTSASRAAVRTAGTTS